MSSIADVVSLLEQVVRKAHEASDHFRGCAEAWNEAGELLRGVLTGSSDPDVESLLAQFALTGDALTRQCQLLDEATTAVEEVVTCLLGRSPATERTPTVGSPGWVAVVGKRIDPSTTKVTTGIGFDDQGNEKVRLTSGRDGNSEAAQVWLVASRSYPKPPGWRPGLLFAAAEHAETKHAIWMRTHGIRHLTVVINHPRVCGPPYGCEVAVRTILPRGWVMTVVSSTSGQVWTLRGVAEK